MTIRILTYVLALTFALPLSAQDDERRWTFSTRLQGSVNSSGSILKLDPSLGYSFNEHFQMYAGIPGYFVRQSPSSLSADPVTSAGSMYGVGNAYLGASFDMNQPVLRYTSNLVVSAPTGDEDKGFSTGRVTADWSNNFSRSFSAVTPFLGIGVANTISDTSFFVRPFSSHGLVYHLEAGATAALGRFASFGGAAYGVRASGDQRIVSKIRRGPSDPTGSGGTTRAPSTRVFETETEVIVPAENAKDNGFYTWLGVYPASNVDFQIGYNRSTQYDLHSLFFGVGFRVGK
jgi:hypothetical protein